MGRGLLRLYGRLLDAADRAVIALVVLAMAAMAAVVVAGVVWRYFFDSPLTWTEELARFLLIFVCFVGAIPIITRGGFGQVESLLRKLSPATRWYADRGVRFLSVVFTGVSSGLSVYLVFISGSVTQQITPAMGVPMQLIYSFMPLGFILMFLRETEQLLLELFGPVQLENGSAD